MSSNAQKAAQDELDAAKKKGASQEVLDGLQAKVDAWSEGGVNKIALHALVGGIMSDFGGSSFGSGAVGAGVNEAIQKELSNITDPALHQWASAVVGAAAAKVVGGNAQAGASTAASGTKNNKLNDYEITQFKQELMTALANGASAEAIQEIIARYKNLAMDERSSLDIFANSSILSSGYSRELNEDAKAFLKDQLGYDWDAAFATIKSYNPNATDADVWDNLYEHVKANDGAIAWGANQNQEDLREASGPVKGDTLLALGKVSSINWGADGIARSVSDKEGNSYELETPISRGDYEYQVNNKEPFADPKTNRWYESTADGDCPVYSLGYVGDYYAKRGYPVKLGDDGGHYTTTPDGISWYTSAPLTVPSNNSSISNPLTENPAAVIGGTIVAAGLDLQNSTNPFGLSKGAGITFGWIKHDVYNEIRNKFGEQGVNKFINAMNKGIVGAEGENGIKLLAGDGIKIGNQFYKYEIKVKGQFGDWRVYGNCDSQSGKIIFSLFDKGKH